VVRPPLRGRRDDARRLVEGVRRTVAKTIVPPGRGDAEAPRERAAEERLAIDVDARFDAARARLRSSVAPRDDEE
jgi:hypothetical protein